MDVEEGLAMGESDYGHVEVLSPCAMEMHPSTAETDIGVIYS
jgi:hypothetical protein